MRKLPRALPAPAQGVALQRGFIHLTVLGSLAIAAALGYYFYHECSVKQQAAAQREAQCAASRPEQQPSSQLQNSR